MEKTENTNRQKLPQIVQKYLGKKKKTKPQTCWCSCFKLSQSLYYSPSHEFFRKLFHLKVTNFFEILYHFSLYFFFFFFLLQISFLTQIVLPEVKMGHFGENIPQGLQENPSLLMCKTCSHFSMAQGIIRKPLGSSPRRAWGFPTGWESASPGHPYSSERLSQLGRLPGHHAWAGGCGGQHLLSFFLTWINIIYSLLPSFLPPSLLPSFF